MNYSQANCEVLVQESKSDCYFSQTFRTSLRQSQSILGLLHCYTVLEYLPLCTTSSAMAPMSSLLNKVIIGFNILLLLLGICSFLFSGLFMEYNEKKRVFQFLRCDMPVPMVSSWFPVGVPEVISVFLAVFWLITSILLSIFIPDLSLYSPRTASMVSLYLPSIWSSCHQLNAISWTTSAFLTVVDLLNFIS